LIGLTGCSSKLKQPQAAPEKIREVAVFQVQKTNVPDYVEATGTVRATLTAQLASQVMGTITSMSVQEGSEVRQGQVLVTLDAAQPQARYQQATAALEGSEQSIAAAAADYALAESTLKRYQMLYEKKSVSPQEFDEVKTRLAAAKARRDAAHAGRAEADAAVAEAKTVVGFSRIRAPFNGVVTAKLADVGAIAAPGVPLLVVEDQGRFRFEAVVDESKMGAVRLGESVPVVVDALGERGFTGRVAQIVPVADPASRSFVVKIEMPADPQVRSGLFGRARFAQGQRESIVVPQTAVFNRGQLQTVYVVGKDQVASLRFVTLGAPSGHEVEVLSGLQNGDLIVAQPGDRELSGKQIEAK
jgi:RND family efflux transporter MFP subunit